MKASRLRFIAASRVPKLAWLARVDIVWIQSKRTSNCLKRITQVEKSVKLKLDSSILSGLISSLVSCSASVSLAALAASYCVANFRSSIVTIASDAQVDSNQAIHTARGVVCELVTAVIAEETHEAPCDLSRCVRRRHFSARCSGTSQDQAAPARASLPQLRGVRAAGSALAWKTSSSPRRHRVSPRAPSSACRRKPLAEVTLG